MKSILSREISCLLINLKDEIHNLNFSKHYLVQACWLAIKILLTLLEDYNVADTNALALINVRSIRLSMVKTFSLTYMFKFFFRWLAYNINKISSTVYFSPDTRCKWILTCDIQTRSLLVLKAVCFIGPFVSTWWVIHQCLAIGICTQNMKPE